MIRILLLHVLFYTGMESKWEWFIVYMYHFQFILYVSPVNLIEIKRNKIWLLVLRLKEMKMSYFSPHCFEYHSREKLERNFMNLENDSNLGVCHFGGGGYESFFQSFLGDTKTFPLSIMQKHFKTIFQSWCII